MMYHPAFGSAVRANPEEVAPTPPEVGAERGDSLPAPTPPASDFMTAIAELLDSDTSPFKDAPLLVKNAFTSAMQLMADNKIADDESIISALNEVLYWFQNIGFPEYSYEVLCDVYANVLRGVDLDPPLQALIRAQWCTEEAKASLREYAPEWAVEFTGSDADSSYGMVFRGEDAVNQLEALLCGEDVGDAQKDFLIKSRSLDLHYLFADFPEDPTSLSSAEDIYFFNAFNAALEGVPLEAPSKDDLLDIYIAGELVGRPKPSRSALFSAVALIAGSAALLKVASSKLKG